MTSQPFAAPPAAYVMRRPPSATAPRGARAALARYEPIISYVVVAAAPPAHAHARTTTPTPGRPNFGLLFAGAAFVFSAALLLIQFGVGTRAYLGLDAHWAANAALTVEARDLGLRAAKHALSIRMAVFGPIGTALAIAGLGALLAGARPR